jgi:uncharacterized GH25 family protein
LAHRRQTTAAKRVLRQKLEIVPVSNDDGLAHLKVTQPGVWMVRVEKRIEEAGKKYDLLALKATLVFFVQ